MRRPSACCSTGSTAWTTRWTLLGRAWSTTGAARAARSRARRELRADGARRRRSRSSRCGSPTDYYLQYALDSTITTLAKAWKPALTAGQPLAADNPAGLAYLLERLEPSELTALPRQHAGAARAAATSGRVAVATAPARRRRLPRRRARSRWTRLWRRSSASMASPAARVPARDLADMLASGEPAQLRRRRVTPSNRWLAPPATTPRARARGRPWCVPMAASNARGARLRPAAAGPTWSGPFASCLTARIAQAMYPLIVETLAADVAAGRGGGARPGAGAAEAHGVTGRFVRITAPGRDRTLAAGRGRSDARRRQHRHARHGHAVEHWCRAARSADMHRMPWTASLTSVQEGANVPAGSPSRARRPAPGGNWTSAAEGQVDEVVVRLPDEGRPGSQGACTSPCSRPIARRSSRATALRRARRPTASCPARPTHAPLENAAMLALTDVPGQGGRHRAPARAPTRRGTRRCRRHHCRAARRPGRAPGRARRSRRSPTRVIAYARDVPPADRDRRRLPPGCRLRARAGRDAAGRTNGRASIGDLERSRSARSPSRPSRRRCGSTWRSSRSTRARTSRLVFVNADEMPHNVLITAQGAMETVAPRGRGDGGDARRLREAVRARHARWCSRRPSSSRRARRRGCASRRPKEPGGYPFVCTFPGHWRTMNGTMNVVREVPGTESR